MDDAAVLARRQRSLRRHRTIRIIGVSLLSLLLAGMMYAWLSPLILTIREASRRRMLARLDYPPQPTSLGVYPLTASLGPWNHGTSIFTPPMPVAFTGPADPAAPPLTIEARDWFDGSTRAGPADHVMIAFNAPHLTWRVHRGRALTLSADDQTASFTCDWERDLDAMGPGAEDFLSFDIPTEFFLRMTRAKQLTGALDGKPFTITPDEQTGLRDFAAYLRPGTNLKPPG